MTDIESASAPATCVRMLGGFELQKGDHVISENSNRSHQMWNLLQFLIAHRRKGVSQAEIIDSLWPDDSSDSPANALKNLVYRVRSTVAATGFPNGKDIIQFESGNYFFNCEAGCVIDIEEFERLCKEAENTSHPLNEQCDLCLEALDLYKGKFLAKSSHVSWVVPLSTYYHGLYLRCINHAINILKQQNRHKEIIAICEKALLIDQFEEVLYEELIRSLIANQNQSRAMSVYQYATDLFYKEMGVTLSSGLRNLYREIIKTVNSVETDLEVIKEDLCESNNIDGAFFCEYEILRNMYRLEARSASRTGQAVFIVLITIMPSHGDMLPTKLINTTMKKLQEAVNMSLRRGDVVSRFSATQFVVMLPSLTFENGQMVMSRITKHFNDLCKDPRILLHSTLQPLDPIL